MSWRPRHYLYTCAPHRNDSLSNDKARDQSFDDCVILAKDTFDPDAVFLDDIVDRYIAEAQAGN